ncbi:MAG: hypothetical protein C0618_09440 [Desulfuromonas sp.]|nr:MAG: hypothetical protein C0618_09440 [Desulfuromonas sp.]
MKKLVLAVVVLLVAGAGVALWWRGPVLPPAPMTPPPIKVEMVPREALLYFGDEQGRYLVSEMRQIAGCDEDSDCVRNLVEALIAGPHDRLLPILPETAVLNSVELQKDLVVLDFNRALVHAHPGGTFSELLTVYGLMNSLTVNFPYLKQLQILIDGQKVSTLKGHVSLLRPVQSDFSYSHPLQDYSTEDNAQ